MSKTPRLPLLVMMGAIACSGGSPSQEDAGAADSGTTVHEDAGVTSHQDAGTASHDAGTPPTTDAGVPDAGAAPEKVGGLVGLYEAKGSVPSGIGSISTLVTLMVPVVAFVKGTVPHAFSDVQNGLGCTGDHFDASHPPVADSNAGTITISGYAGGSFFPSGSSTSPITCMLQGTNYACDYGNGQTAATQPYNSSEEPLGSGPITFAGSGGADFGTFTLQGSPNGTLTVSEDLGSVSYSASSDTTLHYSCAGGCTSSFVLVSLLATQNKPTNPTGSSSTSGTVNCAFAATGSATIPKDAIAAMFGTDSSLQSVTTTVLRTSSNISSTMDSNHQTVVANVGKGVFGIAPK